MQKKMIFHSPLPLLRKAKSASIIRPLKMLDAFKGLGFEVFVVAGYGKERKNLITQLKQKIKQGESFDFVYAESSTQPSALTEKHHLPIYPNLDLNFLRFCKNQNIKIGLFYRDIHWQFPFYGRGLSVWKKRIALFFFKRELKQYQKFVDTLYLPSLEMEKYIPNAQNFQIKTLPPGHGVVEYNEELNYNSILKLFYVGGLNDIYQIHELFKLNSNKNYEVAVSSRSEDWNKVKHEYNSNSNIKRVTLFDEALKEQFLKTHIALLFVKPVKYWTFAMPVKMFEYMGYGLPIIASEGTLSAQFVKENDIGWVIPYDALALEKLLKHLTINIEEIIEKRNNILKLRSLNSWEARAKQVIKDLN